MGDFYAVIKRPLITERATQLKAQSNQYVFVVDLRATKPEIREAVEALFKVNVLKVRTATLPGKFRRLGARRGNWRPDWKKAIVTVQRGQEIKMVEETK